MSAVFRQRHADRLLGLLLFAAALIVYLRTLCPTLYWGDCGELTTAAYTLGITHPTGYPLWVLLAKLWTLLLPVGTIVWRLNTLSAVFGALAAAFFFAFARAIGLPRPIALTAAGLFAFSFTFWQQCLFAETYSLTACYTCLLLFLAARWRARGCRIADLRLLAFVYGLAMTNHQINTLFLPGFALFVLGSDPSLRAWRNKVVRGQWARTLGVGLLPLLLYLYLPLRARMHPQVNWGDPETPFAFWYHVTGRAFAPLMFHSPLHDVGIRLQVWASDLHIEYAWPVVAAALLGLWLLWRRPAGDRPLAWLLTWILLADVVYTINYAIYNNYIYFIPSYVVLAVLAGFGVDALRRVLAQRLNPARQTLAGQWGTACLLILVPVQAISHRQVDLSRNWTCYDYGRNLLASVAPHGVLIENDNDTAGFAMTYLQKVEGYRRDVTIVRRVMLARIYDPPYQAWAGAWYLDQLQQRYPDSRRLYAGNAISPRQALAEDVLRRLMAQAVLLGRPTYVLAPAGAPRFMGDTPLFQDEAGRPMRLDAYLNSRYDLAPAGLLIRLYARGQRPAPAAMLAENRQIWQGYTQRGVYSGEFRKDNYLLPLALDYANGNLCRARLALAAGDYADAGRSYSHVLSLFGCPEAAAGVQRCARLLAAGPAHGSSGATPAKT